MNVLVVYGSKRGGTAGLARMIATSLESRGLQVEVVPAEHAPEPSGYRAVVVAGSLYAGRWNHAAASYVHRHALALRTRPVWLVSSGPLDNTAYQFDIHPVAQVSHAAAHIGAKGTVTFGGRLEPDARGLLARRIAKRYAGDWRDAAKVEQWAQEVVDELAKPSQAA